MARFSIEPTRETLHGSFSREFAPALTIDSGDTVQFRTLDAGWGLEPPTPGGPPRRKFSPRDPIRDPDAGHALSGPIAIRGAKPGMTLQVRIDAVVPGAWGFTFAGGWFNDINPRLNIPDKDQVLVWSLDAKNGIGRDQYGTELALAPFMGIMGMPPDLPGLHSTVPPRVYGGNMDCKELTAGSTLYLPIAVEGALFSVGDGHARQGDGEVSSQGIECPMERVELTFFLREDISISTPRAETPGMWITLGFDPDLNQAMLHATNAMLDLMMELYGIERTLAQAYASLVVDLRVTQIVNGVRGVHAVLPRNALAFTSPIPHARS